jgi:hypothetical protein
MSLHGQARSLTPFSTWREHEEEVMVSGRLCASLAFARRPDDLQVRKPTSWAFQLEDRLSGADFVDDVRESSVAAGAADLGLHERAHCPHLAAHPGCARSGLSRDRGVCHRREPLSLEKIRTIFRTITDSRLRTDPFTPSSGDRRSRFDGQKRPADFQMRLPTPRALQLEEHPSRLDLVDEASQPAVASQTAELMLWWGVTTVGPPWSGCYQGNYVDTTGKSLVPR